MRRLLIWVGMALIAACTDPTPTADRTPPIDAPNDRIATVADQLALTDAGRQILYRLDPEFGGLTGSRRACGEREPLPIMSCQGPERSYVIDVGVERYPGMRELAVAHLVMHEAWSTTPAFVRRGLTPHLRAALQDVESDSLIAHHLDGLADRGLDRSTERHAIVGTMIDGLDPALESYFSQWFDDRALVLFASASATSDLEAAEAELAELARMIDEQRPTLVARGREARARFEAIEAENDRLEQLLDAGRIAEYNAGVAPFNAEADAANAAVDALRADEDAFLDLVLDHNLLHDELLNTFGEVRLPEQEGLPIVVD